MSPRPESLPVPDSLPVPESRRGVARLLAALVVLALLAPVGVSAVNAQPPDLQPGTVERPADGPTVVGVQGFKFAGQGSDKKPARVVGITANASYDWQYGGPSTGARWYYDVDPLPDDDLLVVGVTVDSTVVVRLDRETREVVWREELPYHDTHDVDLLPDGTLLVANMRNYDPESGENGDRMLVYDRERDEAVWEWRFREQGYAPDGGGAYEEDWTHVNDVDRVGEGLYAVSVRNFDQVVVVNRSTKEVEARLGSDGDHETLNEQHNPDVLFGPDGTPSMLVADSENDRIVEYRRECAGGEAGLVAADPDECEWNRTWRLGVEGLNWPRDADRLPNGNTLVTDTLNHRVIEVTPEGRVVWEYYATWGPYDAERIGTGRGSRAGIDALRSTGPTMHELGVTGTHRVTNSAGITPGTGEGRTFDAWVIVTFAGTPLSGAAEDFAARWSHVTPWIRPNWMTGWDFARTLLAGLLVGGWAAVEAAHHRRRLRAAAGDLLGLLRGAVDR